MSLQKQSKADARPSCSFATAYLTIICRSDGGQACRNACVITLQAIYSFLKGEVIKEHKSPVPAMLLVLEGVVVYKQLVDGAEHRLSATEYTEIPPDVIHQVTAEVDAYCILVQ